MRTSIKRFAVTVLLSAGFLSITANFTNASPNDVKPKVKLFAEEKVYSPFVGRDYPDQVLFGDSHFHTNLSFDA